MYTKISDELIMYINLLDNLCSSYYNFLILLSVSCSPFQVMAKRSRSPLSLSVEGWTSESEAENDDRSRPGRKKLKLSLSKKKNSERFEFISGAEVETLGRDCFAA